MYSPTACPALLEINNMLEGVSSANNDEEVKYSSLAGGEDDEHIGVDLVEICSVAP